MSLTLTRFTQSRCGNRLVDNLPGAAVALQGCAHGARSPGWWLSRCLRGVLNTFHALLLSCRSSLLSVAKPARENAAVAFLCLGTAVRSNQRGQGGCSRLAHSELSHEHREECCEHHHSTSYSGNPDDEPRKPLFSGWCRSTLSPKPMTWQQGGAQPQPLSQAVPSGVAGAFSSAHSLGRTVGGQVLLLKDVPN